MSKKNPSRHDYMTDHQKALWATREQKMGRPIPRTHQNCIEILGVARPGKTAKDKKMLP